MDIPQIGSAEEIDFEQRFEGALEKNQIFLPQMYAFLMAKTQYRAFN